MSKCIQRNVCASRLKCRIMPDEEAYVNHCNVYPETKSILLNTFQRVLDSGNGRKKLRVYFAQPFSAGMVFFVYIEHLFSTDYIMLMLPTTFFFCKCGKRLSDSRSSHRTFFLKSFSIARGGKFDFRLWCMCSLHIKKPCITTQTFSALCICHSLYRRAGNLMNK